jgi:regulator of sigma E protease
MDGLIMAGQLLLGLSILVILHELGHFLAARAFGIKVEKFYLFFDAWGFKLFSFKVGDTEYGVGWLPLGGYVKISGMIDESMDTEQLAAPAQPWEFRSKPAWQRLIVMMGGIIVNVVVGIFIFWMMAFKYGDTFVINDKLVNGVNPGIIGKQIGLKTGDRVLAVNGQKLIYFDELLSSKVLFGGSKLTISRNGKTMDIKVPESVLDSVSKYKIKSFVMPRMAAHKIDSVPSPQDLQPSLGIFEKIKALFIKPEPVKVAAPAYEAGIKKGDSVLTVNGKQIRFIDDFTTEVNGNIGKTINVKVLRGTEVLELKPRVSKEGTISLIFPPVLPPSVTLKYGFVESFSIGINKGWSSFTDNAKGIWKMITGKLSTRNISSPIGIASAYGSTFEWEKFWSLTGLISMALAFMNLLPIPALDGGHVVFLIIEMIKGKPLSDKFMERAQVVGFVILLCLMVYAFGNDILKKFGI